MMNLFDLFGGRKAGIAGLTIAAIMTFIGTGVVTPQNQALGLVVVGIIIIAYIAGNVIHGDAPGDGDEEKATPTQ